MHKIKARTAVAAFHTTFKMPTRSYPTCFSSVNCTKPETIVCKSRFLVSIQDQALWNNFAANKKK